MRLMARGVEGGNWASLIQVRLEFDPFFGSSIQQIIFS